jgi:hypothetical protein
MLEEGHKISMEHVPAPFIIVAKERRFQIMATNEMSLSEMEKSSHLVAVEREINEVHGTNLQAVELVIAQPKRSFYIFND